MGAYLAAHQQSGFAPWHYNYQYSGFEGVTEDCASADKNAKGNTYYQWSVERFRHGELPIPNSLRQLSWL